MKKLESTNWDNAIHRAIALGGERAARYVGNGRFLVVSAHDAGAYEVRLDMTSRHPDVKCSCRAAEFGQPCWHGATALLMAGMVDVPADQATAA